MGRLEKWYDPSCDECTVLVSPVCVLCALTSALKTRAEEGSEICPSRVPMGSWAFAKGQQSAKNTSGAICLLSMRRLKRVLRILRSRLAPGNNRKLLRDR